MAPIVMDHGQSLIIPQLFDETNYAYWKVHIRAFLQSLNEKVWLAMSEDEELDDSKFEKLDENDDIQIAYFTHYKNFKKYEKLYRLAMKKLSKVEIEREDLFTKVDEGNQTTGALRFENNFLAKKTKKLDVELFQERAQLKWASSAKLDEMLSIQKSSSDKTGLGYVTSFSTCGISTSTSTSHDVIFVPPYNNIKLQKNHSKMELLKKNKNKNKKWEIYPWCTP